MQENTQRHIQNIKISALSGAGIIFIEVILVLFTIAFKGIDLSFIKLDFEDLMKIIAFLGLLSLVCFLIAIYGVKKYSSARNLFVNIFIIFFVNIVLSIGLFLNLNFMENHYFFRSEKNLANALLLLTYFYTFMCIIFLALKNFYYELARVTKQKYFINAFWCLFIGIYDRHNDRHSVAYYWYDFLCCSLGRITRIIQRNSSNFKIISNL
ncbi:hypothetical protein GNZ76_08450 [Campylobacter coli]|nr:hypothetical protein [Campylobacter coli]EDO8879103.1 hypothetical protein [Campylobacter coli]